MFFLCMLCLTLDALAGLRLCPTSLVRLSVGRRMADEEPLHSALVTKRLDDHEIALRSWQSDVSRGIMSPTTRASLVDACLPDDRRFHCTPAGWFGSGLPTALAPYHLHILDRLEAWARTGFISRAKQCALAAYVDRCAAEVDVSAWDDACRAQLQAEPASSCQHNTLPDHGVSEVGGG